MSFKRIIIVHQRTLREYLIEQKPNKARLEKQKKRRGEMKLI